MSTTADLSDVLSDFIDGVYTATGVAATNNYAVIPIEWADLDGYPEIVVETSIDDTTYFPAKNVDGQNLTQPIKLRLPIEDGKDLLTINSIFGDTPYVRIVIYAGKATAGTISFEINVG